MKTLLALCAALALLGCKDDRTPEEDLALCHKVCGERPIETFEHDNNFGARVECRCGELRLLCDAGACEVRGR